MNYYKSIIKNLISKTSLRKYIFPRWRYNFSASDLVFICGCLEDVRSVEGSIIEVGCEYGETTIFLNNFLKELGLEKQYICLDTFHGFTEKDIQFEVEIRGKIRSRLLGFRYNSKAWFDRTLFDAGFSGIKVFQADATEFNFKSVSPISFCLLDIDLFKPIQACLPKVYEELSRGGIILVDDCNPEDPNYDGAFYAYSEFMGTIGFPVRIIGQKLGLIVKPIT